MRNFFLNNGIEFAVAGIMPDSLTFDMLEYCKNEGIMTVDISIERNKKTMNIPYDLHPSAFAHKEMARKPTSFLKTLLNSAH